jgi:CRP-like cAMP-binding protein
MLHDGLAKNVDPALARKIRTFYSNHYHKRTAMELLPFITGCPPDLRDELAYQLHWIDGKDRGKSDAGLLNKLPFFRDLDTLSSVCICAKMRSVVAVPVETEPDGSRSNLIMVEGTRAETMYVVIEVEMEEENSTPIVLEKRGEELARLGQGDFFGELAALLPLTMKQYRTRTRTAFATAETHLGMLTHDDILQLCAERTEIAEKVVPYVNQIAQTLPPISDEGDTSASNGSMLYALSQSEGRQGEDRDTRPTVPALSMYDIHPVLKTIQPTLNGFEARLRAINQKLDLALAS